MHASSWMRSLGRGLIGLVATTTLSAVLFTSTTGDPIREHPHWHRNAGATSDPITRLYWSALSRPPDAAGHAYWTDQQAKGVSLLTIADSFLVSDEWRHRIGSLPNEDYVDLLYGNVLDRSPDAAGRQYWVTRARQGMDRAHMLLMFSESAEFVRRVDERQADPTPTTDPTPTPTPTPEPTADPDACRSLPASAFDVMVDAADPATWGPGRTEGQLVIYDRFNAGRTTGNFVDDIGLPNLSFNAQNEVHGPGLPNGETWRLKGDVVPGAGPEGNDVPVLRGRYWFDPATAGYRTPTEVGDQHGRVDPAMSDPLFFDGNRFDMAYLEADNLVTAGPDGQRFLWATTFQVRDWMWAADPTTFAFELHQQAEVPGSTPVWGSVANGAFEVASRYSATPVSPASSTNGQTSSRVLTSWPLPPVGSFVSMVWHGKLDPGGSGFLDVWVSVDGGAPEQIVGFGNAFGYVFDPSVAAANGRPSGIDANRSFYLMSKMYDFHEFPSHTAPNWDDTFGVIREGRFVGWAGALDPTIDPLRYLEDQRALLGANCH